MSPTSGVRGEPGIQHEVNRPRPRIAWFGRPNPISTTQSGIHPERLSRRKTWQYNLGDLPDDMLDKRLSLLDIPTRSESLPSIAYDLSRKFSGKFNPSTVVRRRPHKKLRGSFVSIPSYFTSPVVSTNPSSLQSRHASMGGDISTAKTSFDTSFLPLSASRVSYEAPTPALTIVEELEDEAELQSPPGGLPNVLIPQPQPTIKTVEAAANAKVFLETFYNPVLAGKETSRELRRRNLEEALEGSQLTLEQCNQERKAWLVKEREHSRKLRVLKSQSARDRPNAGAGFETIKVLGKGSFGVVRLVREKSESALDAEQIREEGQSASLSEDPSVSLRPVYAMKVIRKSDMIRNGQEGHLRAERDCLVAAEKSRWIVPLLASFQDSSKLYLVMEYMIGGDFLGLLIDRNKLEEKKTQFYIAEMILCVEEAHRMRWIHRDVKPDNFLISSSGHLKISDFGLAFDGHWAHDQKYYQYHRYSLLQKLGIDIAGDGADQDLIEKAEQEGNNSFYLNPKEQKAIDRHAKSSVDGNSKEQPILQWRNRYGRRALASTVVGTSQYMAPEIVLGQEYDGRCDWWSIGIILYEVC